MSEYSGLRKTHTELVEVEVADLSRMPILLPWWILIFIVSLAGTVGLMLGILLLHTLDPFGDRARIETYKEHVLDPLPYVPWIKDFTREERLEALSVNPKEK